MCYADSGPNGGHGAMGKHGWIALIDQAAAAKINALRRRPGPDEEGLQALPLSSSGGTW
jgi:hypothetical protein